MIVCRACGIAKPADAFALRDAATDWRSTLCRPCTAAYQHHWYEANRDVVIARARLRKGRMVAENQIRMWTYLANHPCVDCGETDIVVLEFDHLRDKRANVSRMVAGGFAWETIEAEIAKCEVRCVNCHLRRTARTVGTHDRKHGYMRLEEDPAPYLLLKVPSV